MKKFFFLAVLLVFCFIQKELIAQEVDTTLNIKEVVIVGNRQSTFSVGEKIDKIEAKDLELFSSQSLSDVLSASSLVNMKSYGTSGLTTFRMRGGTADHTAVLWNGFNIQSSMNGEMNLFLVPAFMVDQVQVHYGGEGAVSGSGAVGGVVELNNTFTQKEGLSGQVNLGTGSFGLYRESAKVNFGSKRLKSTLTVNHQKADNDFVYYNEQRFTDKYEKLKNSAYKQFGLAQNNSYALNDKSKLETFLWYQFSDRQVAPQISEVFIDGSDNYTVDNDLRFAAKYLHNGEKWKVTTGAAFFRNSMHYVNSSINTDVTHVANSINLNADAECLFGENHLINIGYSGVGEIVNSPNYANSPSRMQNNLLVSYKYTSPNKKFTEVISLRQGIIDNTFSPLLASMQIRYRLFEEVMFKAKVARNYKVADFNDIYWAGDGAEGNKDLKPEQGWSGDAGLSWARNIGIYNMSADVTGFYSVMSNMIIWQNMGAFWTPVNEDKVKTYGIESKIVFGITKDDLSARLQGQFSYTKAVSDKGTYKGNFLPYIPQISGNAMAFVQYKNYYIQYTENFVGNEYSNLKNDEKEKIDEYWLASLKAGEKITIYGKDVNIAFAIDNIWDVKYETIKYYVMMPRNYNVSVAFNF